MNYELLDGDIAKITLDNGKANAVSFEVSQELMRLLDRARTESKGVLLCGRTGMFTAGFDLKAMAAGPESARKMVGEGMLALEKLYSYPLPVVIACEGHAIGMGVFLLLVADYRIAAKGEYMIRLPETAIDMEFNTVLKTLAKTHIDPLHHSRAIIQSEAYLPDVAAAIGMVDEAIDADQVMAKALEKLKELCELPAARYEENKLFIRDEVIQTVKTALHS